MKRLIIVLLLTVFQLNVMAQNTEGLETTITNINLEKVRYTLKLSFDINLTNNSASPIKLFPPIREFIYNHKDEGKAYGHKFFKTAPYKIDFSYENECDDDLEIEVSLDTEFTEGVDFTNKLITTIAPGETRTFYIRDIHVPDEYLITCEARKNFFQVSYNPEFSEKASDEAKQATDKISWKTEKLEMAVE